MYRHEVYDQLKMEMPFGVTLREDNRWVILSKKFPWEEIDREYQEHFKSSEGQVAIPSRLAFGTLYIQAEEGYTDEQTRRNIQENPYLQYFCGFECYTMESPFDASMMTHFRKRISPEMIQRINDLVFAPEAVASTDNPEEDDSVNQEDSEDPLSAQPTEKSENRGILILDATCCPADIHYPTDVGLLNHARELVEKMIDLLYPAARDLYPEKPRTYRQQARKRYLAYIKKRTHTVRETRMVLRGNLQYIQRDIGYIEKMVAHGVSLSLLGNDLYRKLLVIQELCRQQWDMYVRKSHQIEDRRKGALPVYPVVLPEALILNGDRRILHVFGNVGQIHPLSVLIPIQRFQQLFLAVFVGVVNIAGVGQLVAVKVDVHLRIKVVRYIIIQAAQHDDAAQNADEQQRSQHPADQPPLFCVHLAKRLFLRRSSRGSFMLVFSIFTH